MRTAKVVERLLAALPLALGIVIVTFVLVRIMPGDPVDIMLGQAGNTSAAEIAAMKHEVGLDRPLYVQLGMFLDRLAHGDLGNSFQEHRPVVQLIKETLPATVELALAALVVGLGLAVPIGVVSAVRRNSVVDRLSMGLSFLGISLPAFWLGLVLMMIFAVHWHLLPTSGRLDASVTLRPITGLVVLDSLLSRNWPALKSGVAHLVLPAVTLGAELSAIVARVVRSSMLEVLRQDYVQLARAKGLAEWRVILWHALRNALIPTVTVVGLQLGVLLGGNMIVETVFSWPGLGRLVVGAIFARDYAVVQGAVMFYALTFLAANLLVDVIYTYLNPRITL